MKYDPSIHHRRSIRLPRYDYSQAGAYFITICTQNKANLFWDAVGAGSKPAPVPAQLNALGQIVVDTWLDLPNHNLCIRLGDFVVMPNHVHGIVWISYAAYGTGAGFEPAPTGHPTALPEIVRQFKTFSARRINDARHTPGVAVWQRNYYEHIIRDDNDYERISEYIQSNPLNWDRDDYCIH